MDCLVLGGGGPVGISLLYQLKYHGWTMAVVDPKRPAHRAFHDRCLRGAVRSWTEQAYGVNELRRRLRAEHFDLVIDLTPTMDKRRSLIICDGLGVPLINGTMVDCVDDIHIAAYNFLDNRPKVDNCAHVVASGMNPGAINAMAEEIIQEEEQPDAIVYWEYDDTMPADGKFVGPSITWCTGESVAEINEDWNFEVLEEGTVLLHEDALDSAVQSYKTAGVPLDALPIPPESEAFLIGHEECVYMGWRHDTAVKFIYGFHPENMKLIRQGGYDFKAELLTCSPGKVLRGRDIVGVSCQYGDVWHGSYCMLDNTAAVPADSNATCWLVASGMTASAQLLASQKYKPGVYLTHELADFMAAFRAQATVHSFTLGEPKRAEQVAPEQGNVPAAAGETHRADPVTPLPGGEG